MSIKTRPAAVEAPDMRAKPSRSPNAIVFDLVMTGFVGTLVGISLFSLGPGARLVPLIIGLPTLAGILIVLILDLFPGLRPSRRVSEMPLEKPTEQSAEPADNSHGSENQTAETEQDSHVAADEADEGLAEQTPEARKREITFALWAIGFFILTAIFGLLISIPVALFVFFKLLNRESWVLTLSLTIGTWLFIYVLFAMVLNVRF